MLPVSGLIRPLMILKSVVFPAPFGPIIEVMLLSADSKDSPDIAFNPPKDFETFLAARIFPI